MIEAILLQSFDRPLAPSAAGTSPACQPCCGSSFHQIVPRSVRGAAMGASHSNLGEAFGHAVHAIVSPVLSAMMNLFGKKPEESNDTLRQIAARNEQRAREAQAREDFSREAEAAARSREEAALAKAAEATTALLNGIRPVVMPTTAQVQAAMERMQYDPEKLHFGVCGTSGSGKSSLINAFRGLNRGSGAAAVGVTETTMKVTRFPDPRNEVPYSRFVWYDIPGAGTTAVPDWQYFNDQGLFVLDFIVMVYDVRFTKIDVGIIENCYRFNIPVFIVRSKADQHIDNMMKDEEVECTVGSPEFEKVYEEMKTTYVEAVRSDFRKHMEAMAESPVVEACDREMLLSERVYIVSCANVRKLLSGAKKGQGGVDGRKMIDEVLLLEDMVRAAARRRYSEPEEKGMFRKGRDVVCAGFSSALRLGSGSKTDHSQSLVCSGEVMEREAV